MYAPTDTSSFDSLLAYNFLGAGTAAASVEPLPLRNPFGEKPGCKCGGKCKKKKGAGDLLSALSDPTTLFTDPTTGGTSWSTVAILAALGVGAYFMFFGNNATERRSELSQARTQYQRRRKQILSEFPRTRF